MLVRLSYILAPFTPFLAEELYHNLTGDNESIHLKDWFPAGEVNSVVVEKMEMTRRVISMGMMQRMQEDEYGKIKIRQPLPYVELSSSIKLDKEYEDMIKEELNVKEIKPIEGKIENPVENGYHIILTTEWNVAVRLSQTQLLMRLNKTIIPELKREGLMREVIRHVQSARKKADLQVDDRITLQLTTHDEQLRQAIDEYAEVIAAETLATFGQSDAYSTTVAIEGAELQITLQRQ